MQRRLTLREKAVCRFNEGKEETSSAQRNDNFFAHKQNEAHIPTQAQLRKQQDKRSVLCSHAQIAQANSKSRNQTINEL